MKAKFLVIFISLALLVSFNFTSAQEVELPKAGLTPDSPFYFLETIAEGIGTFFTFGDLKKAERYATLAAERLAEAQAVVEKGKPEFAEKTLARYENQLNNSMTHAERARAKGQNSEKVMEFVGKATPAHLEILAEIYEKVPEDAKPAIENAMKVSVKGHGKAIEILKAQNALGEVPEEVSLPEKVPEEVRERVQMRAQQELEIEKVLQGSESSRDLCEKSGGPPEACEKIPADGFDSFKELKSFFIEFGGPVDQWEVAESKCKELGATTPDKCFRILLFSTVSAVQASEIPQSEEQMEEMRIQREADQKELEKEKVGQVEEQVLQRSESSELLRTLCIERGGGMPSEMCERIPLQGFESFEAEEVWCLEVGGVPEVCAMFETNCRKQGFTTADECFLNFLQGP